MRTLLVICRNRGVYERSPEEIDFMALFSRVSLADADFNVATLSPGTSGESLLHKRFFEEMAL